MSRLCSVEGCSRKHSALGFCRSHYERFRYHGDPLVGRIAPGTAGTYFREVVLAYDGTECLPWPFDRIGRGYGRLNGKLVHRRVCEEINGPPPTPEHDAAHSCGKGHEACCAKRHLSWKTHKENLADMGEHGTSLRGVRNPMAKLTDDDVLQIRALQGTATQREIAGRFGVTRSLVSLIHSRKTRGYLEPQQP